MSGMVVLVVVALTIAASFTVGALVTRGVITSKERWAIESVLDGMVLSAALAASWWGLVVTATLVTCWDLWRWHKTDDDDDDDDRWERRKAWIRAHLPKPAVTGPTPARVSVR